MGTTINQSNNIGTLRIVSIIAAALLFIFSIVFVKFMWVDVDASEIVVIQAPVSGALTVVSDPGWKWRGFGSVTSYPRRAQVDFLAKKSTHPEDLSIQTRFNDGGHGNISGTVNWTMPLKPEQVIALHKDFHGFEAIEQQLIRTTLQKVIYTVGPTMSSTESSAEKRPEIPGYIDDQLTNGPYLTKTVLQNVKDPITGQDKQANVVIIAKDDTGKPQRESISQISHYGILLQPVALDAINYDSVVEGQIRQRQEATTQVQISIANARKAEQAAITTEQEGKAKAATAKWEQETINAKEVALAQKDLQVATLNAQTAEQTKRQLILEGEGEAQKRQLIMSADGALDKKLEVLKAINLAYANAIEHAQPGAWTPSVVMSKDGTGNQGNQASALVDLMTARSATQVGVDLGVVKGNTAKK